jgi:hypothetical protein
MKPCHFSWIGTPLQAYLHSTKIPGPVSVEAGPKTHRSHPQATCEARAAKDALEGCAGELWNRAVSRLTRFAAPQYEAGFMARAWKAS